MKRAPETKSAAGGCVLFGIAILFGGMAVALTLGVAWELLR